MGIDIYMKWKGQTEKQKQAQITGWSVEHGHVGYLREAYHGEPYATKVLVPEAFEEGADYVQIPAAILRERLPATIATAILRSRKIYKENVTEEDASIKAFRHFVELAEKQEERTKEPVSIYASW